MRRVAAAVASGALNLALVCAATLAGLGLIEAAFRIAPAALLPAGVYGFGVRNPALGMNVHGGPVLYNKAGFQRRDPNHDGFLDIDHPETKPSGTERVGFFGDSYVEAAQVPVTDVFYRRLEKMLARPVETLGF